MTAQPKLIAATEFKIEKGLPTPLPERRGKYPFAAMEVGDSFLVPGASPAAMSATYTAWARRHGKTLIGRKVDGGCRIWRTA